MLCESDAVETESRRLHDVVEVVAERCTHLPRVRERPGRRYRAIMLVLEVGRQRPILVLRERQDLHAFPPSTRQRLHLFPSGTGCYFGIIFRIRDGRSEPQNWHDRLQFIAPGYELFSIVKSASMMGLVS